MIQTKHLNSVFYRFGQEDFFEVFLQPELCKEYNSLNNFEGIIIILELRHEISNNVVCATSKGSHQPGHTCTLIRAFSSRLNIL